MSESANTAPQEEMSVFDDPDLRKEPCVNMGGPEGSIQTNRYGDIGLEVCLCGNVFAVQQSTGRRVRASTLAEKDPLAGERLKAFLDAEIEKGEAEIKDKIASMAANRSAATVH